MALVWIVESRCNSSVPPVPLFSHSVYLSFTLLHIPLHRITLFFFLGGGGTGSGSGSLFTLCKWHERCCFYSNETEMLLLCSIDIIGNALANDSSAKKVRGLTLHTTGSSSCYRLYTRARFLSPCFYSSAASPSSQSGGHTGMGRTETFIFWQLPILFPK